MVTAHGMQGRGCSKRVRAEHASLPAMPLSTATQYQLSCYTKSYSMGQVPVLSMDAGQSASPQAWHSQTKAVATWPMLWHDTQSAASGTVLHAHAQHMSGDGAACAPKAHFAFYAGSPCSSTVLDGPVTPCEQQAHSIRLPSCFSSRTQWLHIALSDTARPDIANPLPTFSHPHQS